MVQDLRQIIRSILVEELADHGVNPAGRRSPEVREELVSIRSDRDLARFVERILHLARDAHARADIESGRVVFRLDQSTRGNQSPGPGRYGPLRHETAGRTENFSRGLITESRVHQLPSDVKVISLGKSAVLTPLAKDAVRQAGIKIERTKS